jgi:hypothetical protein
MGVLKLLSEGFPINQKCIATTPVFVVFLLLTPSTYRKNTFTQVRVNIKNIQNFFFKYSVLLYFSGDERHSDPERNRLSR